MSDNDQQGVPPQGAPQDTPPVSGKPLASWDDFLSGQPTEVKTLFDGHISGLKSALQSERDQRETLARQVKDLAKTQKDGSEARTALDDISKKLEAAELQASFYEEAVRPEIGCSNLRLEYLALQSGDFVKRGKVDWAGLKEAYPELFAKAEQRTPPGRAGNGTGAPSAPPIDMNAMIRRAAGRQ